MSAKCHSPVIRWGWRIGEPPPGMLRERKRMSAEAALEEVLNTRLADLLKAAGLDAEPEAKLGRGKRVDIMVAVDGHKVALEAKIGHPSLRGGAAKDDAAGRVEEGAAEVALAVCYPESLSRDGDLDAGTRLWVAPLGGDWAECSITHLVSVVRHAVEDAGDVDAIAMKFREELEFAASRLTEDQRYEIAAASGGPMSDLKAAGVRGALLVASAAMFHARLDRHRQGLRPPKYDARLPNKTLFSGDDWPPAKLADCLAHHDPVGRLTAAWDLILALDYKPVFETGIAVLRAPAQTPTLTAFAKVACNSAVEVSRTIAGLRHDLLGRVFHRILPAAKHTGAFYTSTTAATLLAGLSIPREEPPKMFDVYHYTVVDPACGTGTLLMAAAERIKQVTGDRGRLISKHLIENVIRGYDIELAATHMASVTLGLLVPTVAFDKMNIHRPYLGVVGNHVRAGSLELFDESGQMSLMPSPASEQVETGEETLAAERHSLVIMNPPFTRDSLRYDHLGEGEEKAVKARERELFQNTAAHRSGGSGMFMLLADRLTEEDKATVAAILPTVWLGGPAGRQVWEYLLQRFHLETVVVSHDPERMWFSENTNISESLFVLRRLDEFNRGWPTRFVRFSVNPGEVSGALTAVNALEAGEAPPNATVFYRSRERVMAGDWLPARFLSEFLIDRIDRWFIDQEIDVVRLGDVALVGPAGQGVRGVYKVSAMPDRYARRALWKNDTKRTQTMHGESDTYIVAKPGKQKAADRYWDQRSRLLIPNNSRLNTARVLTVLLDDPAVGSRWLPARPREGIKNPREWEKAMCVWLNSTPGVLAQIMVSTPKVLSRPEMSLEGQRSIPVPDLTGEQAARLAAVFDDQRDAVQERLTSVDGPRRILDEAVALVLGMDTDEVAVARRELAAEPAITARRYGE